MNFQHLYSFKYSEVLSTILTNSSLALSSGRRTSWSFAKAEKASSKSRFFVASAIDAFRKANNHSNLTIIKSLYEIILLLKKEYGKNYIPSEKILLIKPALDIMNSNFFKNDLTVEKLSEHCGISVAYFRRIFTEKYGISPKEYIINRRIDYAKKLLLSEQFSVSEIAEMCGYAEPCHFSREFSKRTGISPNKYSTKKIYKK